MLYCLNNLNAGATESAFENMFVFFFIVIQGKKMIICVLIVFHLESL